ncbi:MAG: hypothetical protein J1F22_08515 [Lachnospiraceae bacterium]|nr:hypothetical protein [Lachnospiraceae bacterium]
MRRNCSILAFVIALSIVVGYVCPQTAKTVSAGTASKKITIKVDSDFTLKLPANWKNQYVKKKSKSKKHGSYVAFYAKKCYQQKKEGWLFSIMRYKDDSYTDMPSYELVGKWRGYNYVALFPTDVQTYGATKAAKKQYTKLNAGSLKAAGSIQPVKKQRKGKNIYRVSDFTLKLPDSWKNNYTVKKSKKIKKGSYVAFYAKKCYKQKKEGHLFSIVRYKDDSYTDMPSYELVGKWKGYNYVALFPTDVQTYGASEAAKKQYNKLNISVEKIIHSIRP